MTDPFALFLNGSYGVGKSATLDHLGDLLAMQGRPFSLMDVDWFHRSWPPAEHDPDNVLVEAQNMSAVWDNFRAAGPRQLVVAGVITSAADRERYARAFGMPVRSVRLVASASVGEARLRRRHRTEQDAALRWHLDRHATLAAGLECADLDELVIDTDDRTPAEVARAVLTHVDARDRLPRNR